MKQLFLLSGLMAAFSTTAVLHAADDKPATTEKSLTNVATELKGKAVTLKDGKYAPSQMNDHIDYYVVYYTASW